jgi:hypothetical protein
MIKRFVTSALLLCLGLALGSCSSVAGTVADHWPHWAGGMNDDVPPRPGAPGYAEFIAHQPTAKPDDAKGAAGAEKTDAKAAVAPGKPPVRGLY